MYREDSEAGGMECRSGHGGPCRGFTLMEVAVTVAASGILLVGLARFFKDFNRSFNTQEQVSDRDLNAHYTVKRLSEALMSAGSSLPSENWNLLTFPDGNPGDHIVLGVNPQGGVQYLPADIVALKDVPVEDAKGFLKATAVLADPQDPALPTLKVAIDLAYNSSGFVKGVKTTGSTAVLHLVSGLTLRAGDAVYAYDEEDYRLLNGNLMLDNMVLAENIQSLAFTAYATNQTLNDLWSSMRSIKIKVTARTRNRDPRYLNNGGFRTIDLSMDVLLRNRI
jgi:prepilin-type N-terminal cleavage/methylation domain-containing protein